MNTCNCSAAIRMQKVSRTLTYEGRSVLCWTVISPAVQLSDCQTQSRINCRIKTQTDAFCKNACDSLYQQAVTGCQDAQAGDFPFHPYEAVLRYTVTYNRNGYLSLYRDAYTFTGGAHGDTVRSADTLCLADGSVVPLSALFAQGTDYRPLLLQLLQKQADLRQQQAPDTFFENYRELMEQNFQEEAFYLTCCGLVLYYPLYTIAPYATGIVPFTVPYETVGCPPPCADSSSSSSSAAR